MFRFVWITFLVIFLCACAPVATSNRELLPSAPHLLPRCGQPFVQEPWHFIHQIEASLPLGRSMTMIGITKIDPGEKTLQGVLTTIEGLVLFDGLWRDGELTVLRAIPPFDGPAFAENMMNDISLLFLVPRIASLTHAAQKERDVVCYYRKGDDRTIDVIIHENRSWSINVFNGELLKEIRAFSLENNIPQFTELKGHAYTLKLTTITAEPDSEGDAGCPEAESGLTTEEKNEI